MSIIIPYDMSRKYTEQNTVFPADLTGQADGDYLKNESGVWVPRTTDELTQDVLYNNEWQILPKEFFEKTAFTGTSAWSSVAGHRCIAFSTGATAGSTARVSSGGADSWAINFYRVDWSMLNIIEMKLNVASSSASTANSKKWVYWGDISTDAVGDPTRKGVGIRADHNAIKGLAHDGAVLTEVALATAFNGAIIRTIRIVSFNGSVQWYVNGVLEGSTALGPTGLSDDNYASCIRMYITNGADAVNNFWIASPFKVYVDF